MKNGGLLTDEQRRKRDSEDQRNVLGFIMQKYFERDEIHDLFLPATTISKRLSSLILAMDNCRRIA
jgi:hypothetical protein